MLSKLVHTEGDNEPLFTTVLKAVVLWIGQGLLAKQLAAHSRKQSQASGDHKVTDTYLPLQYIHSTS
jgi:hypothetical protein